MEARPEIALKTSRIDIIMEVLGWTALAALWIYVAVNYPRLPEIIPTYFGMGGKPDAYGGKESVFVGPSIATVIFMVLFYLQHRPHTFNYMNPITPENIERLYANAVKMVRVMKTCICLLFLLIEYFTTFQLIEDGKADSKWIFIGIFGLIQLPIFYFVIQASKDK
jgi:uncharacterized membrane protein